MQQNDRTSSVRDIENKIMMYGCKIFLLMIACAFTVSVSHAAQARSRSYFHMNESIFYDLVSFPKWTGMVGRFTKQRNIPDSECGKRRYHPCAIRGWKKLIESLRDKPLRVQLHTINNWANRHTYIIDQLNWGINDYWETPHEFMEINGDCEDYAIAKYYSLRALGVPANRMRIMIVQDLNLGGIIHAVLGVYDNDYNLIVLDNQIKQVIPALKIYHYRPIYGINEGNWWTFHPKS